MIYKNEDGTLELRMGGEIFPHHPSSGEPWTQESIEEYLQQLADYREANPPATPPTPPPEPVRVSKIEFRKLLKPQEAATYRLMEAAPKVTVEELQQAFSPTNPDFELQIRVAVEDAMQQFNLLPEFIELNHADTSEFLQILGLAGLFGPNAETRIPQILSNTPPA